MSSGSYDEAVVEKYKNFVGKKEVKQLTKMFKPEKFAGKWKQVMCSPSTSFFGSVPTIVPLKPNIL